MSETTRALALLPSDSEWAKLKEIGSNAYNSGLLPTTVKSAAAASIIALKGYELGLPPMVAYAHIAVVNGKPTCSAELMLASIYQKYPNAEINILTRTATGCTIEARRNPNGKMQTFGFTVEDAKRAGLLGKDVWKNYPEDMCFARAVTRMKRAVWPEVLMGLDYVAEEVEDARDVSQTPGPLPPPPAGDEPVIQTIAKTISVSTPEPPPAPASATAGLKNYAPQSAEAARSWKPGDSDPRKDEPPKQDPPAETSSAPQPRDRASIANEIAQIIRKLGISQKTMLERIKKTFGKEVNSLTSHEMEIFCEMLRNEVPSAS